jgi:exopolyphosphatase / guanosine-5'-triphosphate,3'-diphosphate pyrophosphatase
MDRVMRTVPIEEHTHVIRAIVLLRLAQTLNQDRGTTAPVRVKTRVYPKRVIMDLIPSRGGAELELWSLKKEAPYFREVFRRELFVDVA